MKHRSTRLAAVLTIAGSLANGLALSTLFALSALSAPPAQADPLPGHGWDRVGYAFGLGYGHGIVTRHPQVGNDVADVQLLNIVTSFRYALGDWSDGRKWWAGRLDAVVEPSFVVNFVPETGYGGFITGGFRYRLWPESVFSPYALGTLGPGGIKFGLESQSDGFAFMLQGGVGGRVALSDQFALTTDVRFHHISNAQLTQRNAGIDDIMVVVTLEYR